MLGIIDDFNFKEMAPQKYWAPPSTWSEEKKKETTRSRIFSGEWYAAEKKDGYFELEFGTAGADGVFEWQGMYTLSVLGGGTNEARKMKIVVTPSTDITMKTA